MIAAALTPYFLIRPNTAEVFRKLANIKSAKKRIRQNEKRRLHNRHYRAAARTYVKKARVQIAAGQLDGADEAVDAAVKTLDKAARKGIIHPRNAARRKSRIMSQLAAAQKQAVSAR
jgi:small subunit ribosomal protein S20